jgi:hypothetical protein
LLIFKPPFVPCCGNSVECEALSRSCRFNAGNTGWVGTSIDDIEAVLAGGNIREVWALLYALTKTNYITTIMTTLLSSRSPGTQIAANQKSVCCFKSKQYGLI